MLYLKSLPILWLCFILFPCKTFAVPAYPNKIAVKSSTGKDVYIYLKGDENCKYAISEDGYTLLQDSIGWKYAMKATDGFAAITEYALEAIGEESEELKKFKQKCEKSIPVRKAAGNIQRSSIPTEKAGPSRSRLVGEKNALVILMQFRDVKLKKEVSEFYSLFNEYGYSNNGAYGSVRDFYNFASKGKLDYISHIYGPYTASEDMRYYGGNVNGGNDRNALQLAIEAIDNLPSDIDLSLFDNDKNGTVDNVHIIYAGYGEEAGASANTIWAHAYPYVLPIVHPSGFTFDRYSCTPELRGNTGNHISNIGVICHELGHTLGAMDFYDTDYAANGTFEGTGKWDIMANGSWNDDGRIPSNFNPYVRAYNFGWSDIVELSENNLGEEIIDESHSSSDDIVYKIPTGNSSGDYFLMENRQHQSFDTALPGNGLMVYHVHPKIEQLASTNSINASHPQAFYPVCASYSRPQIREYGNINSSGCPFPGSGNNRSFTPQTSPKAVSWDGADAIVGITNIESNPDGSVSFFIGNQNDSIVNEDTLDTYLCIYKESFEKAMDGVFTIQSISGDRVWNCYPNSSFWTSTEMIPKAIDGKKILTLFTGKNVKMTSSEILSPIIEVKKGTTYNLTFHIQGKTASMGHKPRINIYKVEEGISTLIYTRNDTCTQWETVTVPMVANCDILQYKICGEVSSGGLFIDDITICEDPNAITNIVKLDGAFGKSEIPIYNAMGVRIRDIGGPLPKGVYIQNGKKFYVK